MTDATLATRPATAPAHDKPPSQNTHEVSTMQSALIGGLGGMMPIVATVAAGEHQTLSQLTMQDTDYAVGFALRGVALFFIGAVLVWIHSDVRTRYAAFRLGMTAPALIATVLSSASANTDAVSALRMDGQEVQVASLESAGTLSDALPTHVVFGNDCSFLDGLIGRKCK